MVSSKKETKKKIKRFPTCKKPTCACQTLCFINGLEDWRSYLEELCYNSSDRETLSQNNPTIKPTLNSDLEGHVSIKDTKILMMNYFN